MVPAPSKPCKVAPLCHLRVQVSFSTRRRCATIPSHPSCAVPLFLFEYLTLLLPLVRDAGLSSHCVHACGSAGMRVLGVWCDGACVWPLTPVCPPVPACLSQHAAVWTHLTEAGITHMAARVLSLPRLLRSPVVRRLLPSLSLFLPLFLKRVGELGPRCFRNASFCPTHTQSPKHTDWNLTDLHLTRDPWEKADSRSEHSDAKSQPDPSLSTRAFIQAKPPRESAPSCPERELCPGATRSAAALVSTWRGEIIAGDGDEK
ncbi:hypothetical protein QQF64_004102 [Cirrhinus molitorella]|uniref:Uncharacterized protein n=1 Tax=Cirrhinus molitorella TaxID=172907 RepID=A0ABR3MN68_9TELE